MIYFVSKWYKKQKKFIDGLPKQDKKRITTAIEQLPYVGDIKRLKNHNDLMRLRVGKYRVIYSVDNGKLIIYVIDAGNIGEIYNKY